jgi:hypothetical protein
MMAGGAVALASANAPARQETAKPSIRERPYSAPAHVNKPLPRPGSPWDKGYPKPNSSVPPGVPQPAAPPASNPVPPTGPKLGASVVPPPGRVVGPTWKNANLAPAPLKGDVSPELMKEGGQTGEPRQSLNAGERPPASSQKPRAPTPEEPIVEFAKKGGGPQGPQLKARDPVWFYQEIESLVRAAEAKEPGTPAFDEALQQYLDFLARHESEAERIDNIVTVLARSIVHDNPEVITPRDVFKWLEHRQGPGYVALRQWIELFNRAEELMRHDPNMN